MDYSSGELFLSLSLFFLLFLIRIYSLCVCYIILRQLLVLLSLYVYTSTLCLLLLLARYFSDAQRPPLVPRYGYFLVFLSTFTILPKAKLHIFMYSKLFLLKFPAFQTEKNDPYILITLLWNRSKSTVIYTHQLYSSSCSGTSVKRRR